MKIDGGGDVPPGEIRPPEPRGQLSTKSVVSRATDSVTRDLRVWLVENQVFTPQQVASLSSLADNHGLRLDQLLRQEGTVEEDILLRAFSELSDIPVHSLSDIIMDKEVRDLIPPQLVSRHGVLPLGHQAGRLVLAIDSVPTLQLEDDIRLAYTGRLGWILCRSRELAACIQEYYGLGLRSAVGAAAGEDSSIIYLVDTIIREAIDRGASDIHIEPLEDDLRLRFRVDGILVEARLADGLAAKHRAIVQRVKVLAECNLAERRLPQGGRFSTTLGSRTYDLRVSILPTRHGESVNLRILNRQAGFRDLNALGLAENTLADLRDILRLSHGLVLFTGPTGSGKTTSLYAALHALNDGSRQILTLEDPVEYDMEGIHQVQVNPDIDLTFASGLRSMLRHDPDVVLIGEIRDVETAEIAVSASLTGHLVFSTLHTNDAASAVPRLIDMGVESYLVSTSLEAVVAQRLVRRICAQCREEAPLPAILEPEWQEMRARLDLENTTFYAGRGCPQCRFTGYAGRFPVFELLQITDEIRNLASQSAPATRVREAAKRQGMRMLREDGWRHAASGSTTVDEVLRVTQRAR